MTITPELALAVLTDLNKGNRTKKPEEIRRYAVNMYALTDTAFPFARADEGQTSIGFFDDFRLRTVNAHRFGDASAWNTSFVAWRGPSF